jgi:RNA recognition motif-containing protein
LDFKCDEKKVRDVFSLAGRVRDVTLKRTKEGQSRGMAVVEYEHPSEAVQAVSMFNEQQLYDRIMAVKIDLKDEGKDDGRQMKLPSKKSNKNFILI